MRIAIFIDGSNFYSKLKDLSEILYANQQKLFAHLQAKNKEVEYIGFSHNPSIALIKECKAKRLLVYDDLKSFEFYYANESAR